MFNRGPNAINSTESRHYAQDNLENSGILYPGIFEELKSRDFLVPGFFDPGISRDIPGPGYPVDIPSLVRMHLHRISCQI